MEAKNPVTVAKILKEFLNKKFQGRSGGSYKISRDFLLQLTGRKYLEDSWLKEYLFVTFFNKNLNFGHRS